MPAPTVVQRQADAADAIVRALNTPAEPAPEPVQNVEPAPAPAPISSGEDTWEQRFKTLQGIHRADAARNNAAQQTLQADMNRLRVELEAMQAAQERAKPAQAPSMNPEDVERFGADLVEMVQRGAATAIDAAISRFESTAKTLETRVASLETALNGVSKRTDASLEDQFYATLEKLVPDWKQINDDEGFLAWLAEVDPVYGVQRQVGLSAAHQALRADHAANVFNAFKAQRKPRASPSDLAAPRSSGAPTELAAPEAPTFVTTKDIQTFYHDVSRGAYKGREAEMMRREQEITQAVAENRVR